MSLYRNSESFEDRPLPYPQLKEDLTWLCFDSSPFFPD